jgi:PAS domain-containing protein
MTDRAELPETTLGSFPEGVPLLGRNCHGMVWNQAAQAITGYAAMDVVGRAAPESLRPLLESTGCTGDSGTGTCAALIRETGHGFPVHAQHKLGHEVSAMA